MILMKFPWKCLVFLDTRSGTFAKKTWIGQAALDWCTSQFHLRPAPPRADPRALAVFCQPRPQGFSLKKWVGREKALASAGHVYSLNIPEKLIYMQPAGFALTEVERSNNGK